MADSDQTNTNEKVIPINPLLFLSEQLIHLEEGLSSSNAFFSAHVSDDDGSPSPPTTCPSTTTPFSSTTGHMVDGVFKKTAIQQYAQGIDRYRNSMNDVENDNENDDEVHSPTSSPSECMEEQDDDKTHRTTTARDTEQVEARHATHSSSSTAAAADIGSMVLKAKRAAASLWLVLHAQECRYGGDKCPFQGCLEMKSLLLHVKNCPSTTHTTCPEQIQGCTQTRKLLAHYRRCREMRFLKRNYTNGNSSSLPSSSSSIPGNLTSASSSSLASHPSCLICSLLARHARNVMESTSAASTLASIGLTSPSSSSPSSSSYLMPLSNSMSVSMPPPPPRPRTCSLGSMPQHQQQPTLLGSTALAQIIPLPPQHSSFSSPTPRFTNNTWGTNDNNNNTIQTVPSHHHIIGRGGGRPRATSLDEHNPRHHHNFHSKKNLFIKSGNGLVHHHHNHYPHSRDPTLEFGILDSLRNNKESSLSLSSIDESGGNGGDGME